MLPLLLVGVSRLLGVDGILSSPTMTTKTGLQSSLLYFIDGYSD